MHQRPTVVNASSAWPGFLESTPQEDTPNDALKETGAFYSAGNEVAKPDPVMSVRESRYTAILAMKVLASDVFLVG
jgi:hypothetical protein